MKNRRNPIILWAGLAVFLAAVLSMTQIVRNEGHFGDIDHPYPTFELLYRLIG